MGLRIICQQKSLHFVHNHVYFAIVILGVRSQILVFGDAIFWNRFPSANPGRISQAADAAQISLWSAQRKNHLSVRERTPTSPPHFHSWRDRVETAPQRASLAQACAEHGPTSARPNPMQTRRRRTAGAAARRHPTRSRATPFSSPGRFVQAHAHAGAGFPHHLV